MRVCVCVCARFTIMPSNEFRREEGRQEKREKEKHAAQKKSKTCWHWNSAWILLAADADGLEVFPEF